LKVAVVGAGGVGGLLGGLLARAGEDVTFLVRHPTLGALRSEGLEIVGDAPAFRLGVRAEESADSIGPVDLVLVAVKTWQVAEVAPSLRPLLGAETLVVPLQNGVEAADTLRTALGPRSVVGGLARMWSWIQKPGVIEHRGGPPHVTFGPPSPAADRILRSLAAAGIDARLVADIEVKTWEKLLFVEPMGSVGAVTRSPVGVFRSVPESRALLIECQREIAQLARARGIPLGDDAADRALADVDQSDPAGIASLHRDIVAGRRSELFEQTGAVVRLAAPFGLPVPAHQFIFSALLPQELAARKKTG
jgi:2-dehydropantoate 2-reductase